MKATKAVNPLQRPVVGRLILSIFAAAFVLALAGCANKHVPANGAEVPRDRPNIIFVMVDDMGWNDLGYQGSEILTPNIDELAASGLKLNRMYAYPICSPTRAALMTGQNPIRYGVDGPMENDAQLDASLTLLPEYLKAEGYDTWLVGKWHLGMGDVAAMPQNRGFDHFYGHLGGFIDFYTHVYFGGLDWQRNGTSVREEGFATQLLTNEAIKLISEGRSDNPFFMFLSYNAPHTPLQYPPSTPEDYSEIADADRRVYAQMMSNLDEDLGRLRSTLQSEGIQEDTLIVFMSDNGGNVEAGAHNGDLRGSKGDVLEGGVRVPAFIVWPGQIEPGQVSDQPVFVQDWLPTLITIAGGEQPLGLEGQNVWPALPSDERSQDSIPVIVGTEKQKAVFDWPYKLIQANGHDGEHQLFNVVADPRETTDLAAQYPQKVEELIALIAELPVSESKAARGPPPEALFRDEAGEFIHDIRKPETRKPWAESAIGARSMGAVEE
ncbi:MAG: arylsulfatase B [Henriciella sp.]